MNVYLVRHGEPKRAEEDPRKPLSERGQEDVRRVAVFVAERLDVPVERIVHSGKLRAQQTAEVFGECLHPFEGLEEGKGLKPLDDPGIWVQRLAGLEEETMLVGHLPHLSKLVSRLVCHDENLEVVRFAAGALVCLGRDESGLWSIAWMVNPRTV